MRRSVLCLAFFALWLAILLAIAVNKTQAASSKKIEMYPSSMTGFPTKMTGYSATIYGLPETMTGIPNSQQSKTLIPVGSERYLTSISSDKPTYQVNEKVFIRGVVLNGQNRKPLPEGNSLTATIQIRGPNNKLIASGSTTTRNSVWAFEWQPADTLPGGEYTIFATYPESACIAAERKIDIRSYREPRLSTQITFQRDGYGPGDKVTANLSVKRAEGGFPTGATVTVDAKVDGTELSAESGKVDAKGFCTISFNLPGKILRGEGTLALSIHDGEIVEAAAKTIPILLQTVDIQMFPEGGDLVAGYENRVYVQASQPTGKPADLVAVVVSDANHKQVVAQFQTEHEGRGKFQFVPRANVHYSLKILKPSGIKALYPLPQVKATGAIIRTDINVYKRKQPITVQIGTTQKKFRVVVSKREQKLVSRNFDFSSPTNHRHGELQSITLPVDSNADGVLIVTVSDVNGLPLAERLIFREPTKPLVIKIKPDKNNYAPGDVVKLSIKTTDLENKPMASVVGVTVTDETLLKMVDKRDRSLRLPVMMYLEPEVKELADASVYFDPHNAKAPLAIDLLLGTQGWRRFALVDIHKFILENGDKGRRALAFNEATSQAHSSPWPAFQASFGNQQQQPVSGQLKTTSARWHFQPTYYKLEQQALPHRYNPPEHRGILGLDPAYLPDRKQPSPLLHNRGAFTVELLDKEVDRRFVRNGRLSRPGATGVYAHAHNDFLIVREYAHHINDTKSNSADRNDFGDTVYWNAGVKTDARGEAEISFQLNDSITTFQTFADAFSINGSLGDANAPLKSIRAFYVEPKLPLQVLPGDRILLPVNLVNGTSAKLDGVTVKTTLPAFFKLTPPSKQDQHLKPKERAREILPIEVGYGHGTFDFVLNAAANSYHDKVVRPIQVAPCGFPVEKTFGGILEPGKKVSLKISVEKNLVPGSMVSNVQLLPSSLAKLTAALERLIQDPYGCFEQTSSTSYPLTMAQQYFLTHSNVDPKLVESSKEKLEKAYQRLLGFRCKDLGYECFGQDPGHEALTAYGLLHFTEMAKVKDVDQKMIATTRSWLLSQKDGQGGFSRTRISGHSWLEDKNCSNAYILWALLESGEPPANLQKELAALKSAVDNDQNSYVLALAANAFAISGDRDEAKLLMDRLAERQKADGSVIGISASMVGSGGEALKIEGTSLATLAWLRNPEYVGNVDKSIKFLAESCKNGRYSSTQATILALRCIVDYDKQHLKQVAPGKVHLNVDGHPIGDGIAFNSSTLEPIKLPDLSEILCAGEHEIELSMDEGSALPYTVGIKYNRLTPTSDKDCKVDLKVTLAQNKLLEGKSTEANVTVTNNTSAMIPNPIAIVGLPGGLEPRHDQLKELVKRGKIDAYEIRGKEVVLYWRSMPSTASFQIPLSLIAVVPGTYTGPASRAYLYYTDEKKNWTDGLHVEITPN